MFGNVLNAYQNKSSLEVNEFSLTAQNKNNDF